MNEENKKEETFKEKFDKVMDTTYKAMVGTTKAIGAVTLVGGTFILCGGLDLLDKLGRKDK